MPLDPDVCYRALRTRDARFDGRFFTGVRSTGVYCRPVCPARTPKRENCVFLPCAAAAQEAGFRPCLRCRPEASPGTPAWVGTCAPIARALRLIDEGALDRASVAALAERVGLGERQLRRLFLRHVGATPVAVAQTRRVGFAKKLLDETALPVGEIALASGFASVRRFNEAMRAAYGRAPRELRRRGGQDGQPARGSWIALRLPFRPPFDWGALLAFLEPRAIPGVEGVRDGAYERTVSRGPVRGRVEVRLAPDAPHLVARLRLSGAGELIRVAEGLRRTFDLTADPAPIAAQLRADARLRPLVRARPGLRVPGAWDGFELAVRAILGQQVSVRGATTLAGRLVERFGHALDPELCAEGSPDRVFPTAAVLADADLRSIGLPRARAGAVAALAEAVAAGRLALEPGGDAEATRAALCALPGVGPWTAQYVAMRALGEPDAFPASDLGLRHALANGSLPTPAAVERAAEAWRPWRAYAALHLWTGRSAPRPAAGRRRAARAR
ncbi:MAG: AlkA N-terminal domain-containing protein [Myxococcota bacterium]|nr:AlkA N-terminal domain-containing protein [Myxococcota bacterium]